MLLNIPVCDKTLHGTRDTPPLMANVIIFFSYFNRYDSWDTHICTGCFLWLVFKGSFCVLELKETGFPQYIFVLLGQGKAGPRLGSSDQDSVRSGTFWCKNVTSPTGGSNRPSRHVTIDKKCDVTNRGSSWPPLIQKTWHYQQGDPTDLLWCKMVTLPTGRSNWPPLIQKHDVTVLG